MSLKDLLSKGSVRVAVSALVSKIESKISENPDVIREYIESGKSLVDMIPEKYVPFVKNFFRKRPDIISLFEPDNFVNLLFTVSRDFNSWALGYAVGFVRAHPKGMEWLVRNYNDFLKLVFGLEFEEVSGGGSKHRGVQRVSRKARKKKNR